MKRTQSEKGNTYREGIPHALKVLMYHRVVADRQLSHAHWTCLHVQQLRKQLEMLDRWGFTPITFQDYWLFLQGQLDLPRKPVILTFDDGYLDTYENAFPLLQEYGVKAVIFAIGNPQIRTNVWDEALKLPIAPLMEGKHLIEMHTAGFEIGAHSMNHAKLTTLNDEEASEEISRSRTLLETLVNAPVRSFSYPHGLVNEKVKSMVAEAGYNFGCAVFSGPATFGMEPYEIRRITIPGTIGFLGFGSRLLAPYQHYEWLLWKTRQTLLQIEKRRNGHKETWGVNKITKRGTDVYST